MTTHIQRAALAIVVIAVLFALAYSAGQAGVDFMSQVIPS